MVWEVSAEYYTRVAKSFPKGVRTSSQKAFLVWLHLASLPSLATDISIGPGSTADLGICKTYLA